MRAELYDLHTDVGLFYQLLVDLFVIYFSMTVVLSEDYLISCILCDRNVIKPDTSGQYDVSNMDLFIA